MAKGSISGVHFFVFPATKSLGQRSCPGHQLCFIRSEPAVQGTSITKMETKDARSPHSTCPGLCPGSKWNRCLISMISMISDSWVVHDGSLARDEFQSRRCTATVGAMDLTHLPHHRPL